MAIAAGPPPSLSLSLFRSFSLPPSLSLSLSFPLSISLSRARSLSLSLSLSLSVFLSPSLYLPLSLPLSPADWPPWRQPRVKSTVYVVNSHTHATRIGWHLWEIDLRFAPGLPPGWLVGSFMSLLGPMMAEIVEPRLMSKSVPPPRPYCRANTAHVSQSRPDSCLGFKGKVLKFLSKCVPGRV